MRKKLTENVFRDVSNPLGYSPGESDHVKVCFGGTDIDEIENR